MSGQHMESLFLSYFKSFLIAFADKPAVWYSLKPIGDDVPSLPGLLNLSYDQMVHIFDVCGLWDVSATRFKITRLKFFIDSNSLAKVVEHTKLGLRNHTSGVIENHHVLCVGNQNLGIINKPCHAPPQTAMRPLRKLGALQNNFKEKITKACRQFLVDGGVTSLNGTNNKNAIGKFVEMFGLQKGTQQNEQRKNVGDSSCSLLLEEPTSDSVVDDENLLHFRIRTRLLPILLAENFKTNIKEVEKVLFGIAADLQKERKERISNTLGSN